MIGSYSNQFRPIQTNLNEHSLISLTQFEESDVKYKSGLAPGHEGLTAGEESLLYGVESLGQQIDIQILGLVKSELGNEV